MLFKVQGEGTLFSIFLIFALSKNKEKCRKKEVTTTCVGKKFPDKWHTFG